MAATLAMGRRAGGARGGTLAGIEGLIGSRFSDRLGGGAGANRLTGSGGNDQLFGLDGEDTLLGGAGSNRMEGGADSDIYGAGEGNDAVVDTGATRDIIRIGSLDDLLFSQRVGNDMVLSLSKGVKVTVEDQFIAGHNVETLLDGRGRLVLATGFLGNQLGGMLSGTGRSDRLDGRGGGARLFGRQGADTLIGGDGDDRLAGGAGNDRLHGGKGADRLYGGDVGKGLGNDVFVFENTGESPQEARDTIFGFGSGGRIDLSAIDANGAAKGSPAFIGTRKFGGHAGELRFDKTKSGTTVHVDINGDRKTDLSIHLDDAITLVKADFLL